MAWRPSIRTLAFGVVVLVVVVVAAIAAVPQWAAQTEDPGISTTGRSPATLTARSKTVHHYEYVLPEGEIDVYDIDHGHRLVQTIELPHVTPMKGVAASPRRGILYISYGGNGGYAGNGSMLAYNLRTGRVLWDRHYDSGVDSFALTPNGRTIYLPAGENSSSGVWTIVDASTGSSTGSITAGRGAHNGLVGRSGRYAYLAGVDEPYLYVASTASNTVVRKVGPLNGPGVRPFTINRTETLAFTTARSFLGFQVSDLSTGKVLYSVAPPGFSFDLKTFGRTPDHGIALSPDGRRLYLIDTPNGYVHVFDTSGLPSSAPRDIADIKLAHPPPYDGWLATSRDGRYLYVGRAGDVIDTRTLQIVRYLAPMQHTADFIEIDWRRGRPVSTTSRYGITTP
jgi:DNA-binding beta-propeller fold protein YncE